MMDVYSEPYGNNCPWYGEFITSDQQKEELESHPSQVSKYSNELPQFKKDKVKKTIQPIDSIKGMCIEL